VNISYYARNVLAGVKEQRGHKSFDSALKEVFMRADIDEEELIEIAKENNVYKQSDNNNNKDSDSNNNSDDDSESTNTGMEDMW